MHKRKLNEINKDNAKKPKSNGFWAMGLLKAMEDPKLLVKTDNLITVIKDAYPKATFHYLVLPKQDVSNLKALNKGHLELIEHMEDVAREIINDNIHKSHKFKLGYHSEASMHRLHMHVISDDMNSVFLRTKKHWNSFNTEFFLDSAEIRSSIEIKGKVDLPSKEACKKFMELPLVCHKCDYIPKNMPDLKKHILNHVIYDGDKGSK